MAAPSKIRLGTASPVTQATTAKTLEQLAYIGGYPRRVCFKPVENSAVDLGDTVGDGCGAGDAWVYGRLGDDGAPYYLTASESNSNDKKKTKWYLEPWAVTSGIQSTIRHGKSVSRRRKKSSIKKFPVRHEAAMRLQNFNPNAHTILMHHHALLPPLYYQHQHHHHPHQQHVPQLMQGLAEGPYTGFISPIS